MSRLQIHAIVSCPVVCWCPWRKAADDNLAGEQEAKYGTDPQTDHLYHFNRKDKSNVDNNVTILF